MKNGLINEDGKIVFYKDDKPYHAGVISVDDCIYYVGSDGCAVTGEHRIHSEMTNGIIKRGVYLFGNDGKLICEVPQKNGLIKENGELIYYDNGERKHAGAIKIDGDIYYIGSHGSAVKGRHIIHSDMSNKLLKSGVYTFGEDYKLVKGSYQRRKKHKSKHRSESRTKKIEKRFFVCIATVMVLTLITLILIGVFKKTGDDPVTDITTLSDNTDACIVLPEFDDDVPLCSDQALSVYQRKTSVISEINSGDPYRPFVFEYQLVDTDGLLKLSEFQDFQNATEFIISASETSISIDNLKTGTTYYYKVTIDGVDYPGSFRTAESTRFVNIAGLKNTRDIGGYTTLDGKRVKQGILIRGTEIDALVEPSFFLDKNSVDYVNNTFGFVCDLDLRESSLFNGTYQTRLGKDIEHKFYNSPMYGSVFSADYQTALRQIFADLADPRNYPMYMHCTYGADRTGTICFLLEGVLNFPEEVMQMDYQLTGFSRSEYASSNSFNSIYGGVEGYDGDTVQEKIVNYLTSPEVGVTMEEIESIRNIFLEK